MLTFMKVALNSFYYRIRSNGIRKTFIVKYQCCSGYLRVGDKRECSEGNQHAQSIK